MPNKSLKRITPEGGYGGVCSGIAYWLEIPTWVVKLVWIILLVIFPPIIFLYVALAYILPKYDEIPEDYKKVCE
ncbi:PspC domain-containing protein [Candidatus Wolfebacteria bacterium]|nr:PspC domain-containing protein [Candidatus Wolfebacteria bacterium]